MELHVNGQRHEVDVDPERTLLSVLRDELDLVGCKYGCGQAQCGACTVLLDGMPVHACVTRVGAVGQQAVRTVESLANGDELHPVQEAFVECGALQCGFCTTGMIMQAVALIEEDDRPSVQKIVRHMDGNICRCGAYPRIVRAIEQAAERMRGGSHASS